MVVITWLQAILGICATILTISGVVVAWLSRGRAERRDKREFDRVFRSDWMGTPQRPGVPGRPGVMAQLLDLTEGIAALRERLRRAELDIRDLRSKYTVLFNRLSKVEHDCPLSELGTAQPTTEENLFALSSYEGERP